MIVYLMITDYAETMGINAIIMLLCSLSRVIMYT